MTKLIQNVFKIHPKSIENGTQIHQKSLKIDKNGALGALGGILGDFWAPGRSQEGLGGSPGKKTVFYVDSFEFFAKME